MPAIHEFPNVSKYRTGRVPGVLTCIHSLSNGSFCERIVRYFHMLVQLKTTKESKECEKYLSFCWQP